MFKKSVSDSLSNIKHVIQHLKKVTLCFERLNLTLIKKLYKQNTSIKDETNSDIDIKKAEIRLNKFSSEPAQAYSLKIFGK